MPESEISNLLAQAPDWIEGLIVVAIVVFSAIGSLGKWIVQKIEERRERLKQQRGGLAVGGQESVRRPLAQSGGHDEVQSNIPPFAAPAGPMFPRRRSAESPVHPPIMERIFEALAEQASRKKPFERDREPTRRPPPPPSSPQGPVRKKPQVRPVPQPSQRPETISERAQARDRVRANAVELEAQRLAQREQKWTDDTDRRLGHVETHIPSGGNDESILEVMDVSDAFEDPSSLRRAFVISEILSPPLALRESH